MAALPTITELCNNFDSISNIEEVIILHPAIDCKLVKEFFSKININKLRETYQAMKKKGKLKPTSYEFAEMLEKHFNVNIQ